MSRINAVRWLLVSGVLLIGVGCSDEDRPGTPCEPCATGEGEGEGLEGEGQGAEGEGEGPAGGPDGGLEPEPDTGRLGETGDPCLENMDCLSGWCVPYRNGHVCTRPCGDGCAPGWFCRMVTNAGGDVTAICVAPDDRLCASCTDSADCDGGLCLRLDLRENNLYCTQPCQEGECRDGFTCGQVTLSEEEVLDNYCLPVAGTCSCTQENQGADRLCRSSNEQGTCLGREFCTEQGWEGCTAPEPTTELCNLRDDDCNGFVDDVLGLGQPCSRTQAGELDAELLACPGVLVCLPDVPEPQCSAREPAVERCNRLDDDCDGAVDEDFPGLDEPCQAGAGGCLRYGFRVCNEAGDGLRCNAEAGQPSVEVCDGRDNDCDDVIDEEFPDLGQPCGAGRGACFRQGVIRCSPDGSAAECSVEAGPPGEELCNGLDDDCDEEVDEGFPDLWVPCTVGEGACRSHGFIQCTADGRTAACNAEVILPTAELCNGLDDDCDGQVDEEYPNLLTACNAGLGICLRQGVRVCTPDGQGTRCSATAGEPLEELCNGLDDNCDGLIDEQYPDLFQGCTSGQGVCQAAGTRICAEDGRSTVCDAIAGEPGVERCNGLDDDCDGQVDNGFDGLGAPCTAGAGACLRIGVARCTGDGLGTTCSAEAGEPTPERCNSIDDDCDGLIDEEPGWANVGQACSAGLGSCTRSGVYQCDPADPGGPTRCTAVAGAPTPERCDGLDNDCNGQVDDQLTDAQPCDNQAGVCAGSWKSCGGVRGYLPCNNSDYPESYESTETRCDGLDNDCDGHADRGLVGPPCPLQFGVCAGSRAVCENGAWAACTAAQYGAAFVAPEQRCDMLDNDCDGQTDEGFLNNGQYDQDQACGNCFTDCTAIYARPAAYGICQGARTCVMQCCRAGDPHPRCAAGHDAFDLNGVPNDGCEFALDGGAIYVSVNDPAGPLDVQGCGLGPSATGGGRTPCRSIGFGLAEAKRLGRSRVLVADGLYEETVTLQNGISLLGGYRADTWERHVDATGTILRGREDGTHKRTIVAPAITAATTVEGFVLYGQPATAVGGNSYVVYVTGADADLRLVRNTIYSAAAGPGASQGAAPKGADGVDGLGRTAATSYVRNNLNRAIPDNNAGGVSDTVTVPAGGNCAIGHLLVDINISHTWPEDLVVELVSPVGITVQLANRPAMFAANDQNLVGRWPVSLAQAGPTLLTALNGRNSQGNWTLRVSDRDALVTGTLNSWALQVGCNGPLYDAVITDDVSACDNSDNRQYANGGVLSCGGVEVSGGNGGGNSCPPTPGAKASGRDGVAGKTGGGGGLAGAAGEAGSDGEMAWNAAGGASCFIPPRTMGGASGVNGGAGTSGAAGAGCNTPAGSIQNGHWSGGTAANGGGGTPGGGGGGGGAGGGGKCTSTADGDPCDSRDRLGGHGGGGGSGGCGGSAGAGGGGGGSSFGIYIQNGSAPTIQQNTLILGMGGAGGAGGNGGVGGSGGHGMEGGLCTGDCFCYMAGGKGGEGGRGGHGGGGGGGCGGSAFGIFGVGIGNPTYCAAGAMTNPASGGVAGAGGQGGASLGQAGGAGQAGLVAPCSFR